MGVAGTASVARVTGGGVEGGVRVGVWARTGAEVRIGLGLLRRWRFACDSTDSEMTLPRGRFLVLEFWAGWSFGIVGELS